MQRKTILVDLLPVLPGGLNGGAKVMVIDLLNTMIRLSPHMDWILLIKPGVEKELECLKVSHVKFFILNDIPFILRFNAGIRFLNLLRNKFSISNRVYSRIFRILNTSIFYGIKTPQEIVFDLLFCPFTAPIFHQKHLPTVSVIYDLQYLTYPQFFEFEDFVHRKYVMKHACEKSKYLISISDYSKKSVMSSHKISENTVKSIPICLSQRLNMDLNSNEILNKYNISAKKYFIYPANFWKHKNHEMLLLAFRMISDELHQDISLVLTGAPCERQKFLKKFVARQGLEKKILFLDYVSDDELAVLMKNSLALIFPSLYEGFGMPVVEAMSLGVPVLCSNVTSLPEVAGEAALLFDPKDLESMKKAMFFILQDETLRETLIQKGYIQAQKFSDIEQMATQYLDVFHQAIEEHS